MFFRRSGRNVALYRSFQSAVHLGHTAVRMRNLTEIRLEIRIGVNWSKTKTSSNMVLKFGDLWQGLP
jgi:hypothetical protein